MMRADDERHGTLAGHRAHSNSGTVACQPCRDAKNAYSRSRDAMPRSGRTRADYIESGYDPKDGLEGGRWMFDDQRRLLVWVQIQPVAEPTPLPNRKCHACGTEVGPRFRFCAPCGRTNLRESKRLYEQRKRAAA